MIDDFGDIQTKMRMHIMGIRYRAGHAKAEPIGDRMINAVRAAIWEAWEMGLDNGGENIYPRLPLLDRESVEPVEPEEPEAPEM
jgi:hypothetical protein